MKRNLFILIVLLAVSFVSQAQLIKDRTNGMFTLGFDLFTDFNMGGSYENFNLRGFNQGFDTYMTFNLPMERTKHTVSVGVGVTSHNYYMKNAWLAEPYADTLNFVSLESCDNSKLNLNYFDIPLELNFRIADKFKISVGGKVGFLMSSKSKCKGKINASDALNPDTHNWEVRYGSVSNLERIVYSATLRVAYRCLNVFCSYQFTNSVQKGKGPDIMPLSVGIGIRAF